MRRVFRTSVVVAVSAAFVAPLALPFTAAADPIDDKRQQVEQITDHLEDLERQSDVLAEQYVVALDTQRQLEADVAEAEQQVKAQEAELTQLERELSTVAVQNYMGSSTSALGPMFADTTSITDGLQRDQLARVALDAGTATTDDYDAALTELNDDRDRLEHKQAEAADQAEAVDAAKQATDEQQREYQQARAEAEAELGDLIREEEERRARESYERMLEQQRQLAAQAEADAAAARQAQEQAAAQSQAEAQQQARAQESQASQQQARPQVQEQRPQVQQQQPAAQSQDRPQAQAPAPQQAAPEPEAPSAPPASGRGGVAVSAARTQLGVPYRFAAASPGVAFDCSGLTSWAWGQAGVYLPHQSAQQFAAVPHVSQSQAQPGDLIFYYSPISHVALYMGGGQQIHAPNTGTVVNIASTNWGRVVGVGRPG